MRVKDGKILRPEELTEIAGVGNDCVNQAVSERQAGGDCAAFLLNPESNPTRGQTQGEERKFLQKQRERGSGRVPVCWRYGLVEPGERRSSERPVIEKNKDEGQRDKHRLAHQAADEEKQRKEIPHGVV